VKVSAREKKSIIVGAVVIAAVAIFYVLTSQLPSPGSLSETVELKRKMLLQRRETLNREETYRTRIEQYMKHLQEDMTRLLPGDNPNVAGAELQKILKDFADANGVEITQMNVLPEKNVQDRISRVSVRIETNCVLDQLMPFLTNIENYGKFLTIDEFMITGFMIQKKPVIRPSLTVSGYIASIESKAGENR
jgi:type II secretory pathway component PulM